MNYRTIAARAVAHHLRAIARLLPDLSEDQHEIVISGSSKVTSAENGLEYIAKALEATLESPK